MANKGRRKSPIVGTRLSWLGRCYLHLAHITLNQIQRRSTGCCYSSPTPGQYHWAGALDVDDDDDDSAGSCRGRWPRKLQTALTANTCNDLRAREQHYLQMESIGLLHNWHVEQHCFDRCSFGEDKKIIIIKNWTLCYSLHNLYSSRVVGFHKCVIWGNLHFCSFQCILELSLAVFIFCSFFLYHLSGHVYYEESAGDPINAPSLDRTVGEIIKC